MIAVVSIWGFREVRAEAIKRAEAAAAEKLDRLLDGERIRELIEVKVSEKADSVLVDLLVSKTYWNRYPSGEEIPPGSVGESYPEDGGTRRAGPSSSRESQADHSIVPAIRAG